MDILKSIGKQSGESGESVPKKKKGVTVRNLQKKRLKSKR